MSEKVSYTDYIKYTAMSAEQLKQKYTNYQYLSLMKIVNNKGLTDFEMKELKKLKLVGENNKLTLLGQTVIRKLSQSVDKKPKKFADTGEREISWLKKNTKDSASVPTKEKPQTTESTSSSKC
jgi:hypothetical protein